MYTIHWYTGYKFANDGYIHSQCGDYTIIADKNSLAKIVWLIQESIKHRKYSRLDIYLNGKLCNINGQQL